MSARGMGVRNSRKDGDSGSGPFGARAAWAQQTLALDVLRDVVAACDRAAIDVLPVKGVITSRRLYDDVAERPIADIDLRVRPADLLRVRDLGRAAGWHESLFSRAYGMLSFEIAGLLVELEAHVGPPAMCSITIDELLARAERRTDPFGFAHLEPELHDHCLLTCVNVFKDKLTEVPEASLRDLERFVARSDFEPSTLIDRARVARVETIVWIVADWMARTRGDERWAHVRSHLGERAPRPRYAALFARLVDANATPSFGMRLVARFANDDVAQWPRALLAMAWRIAEARS
jgi:hypothetical protein